MSATTVEALTRLPRQHLEDLFLLEPFEHEHRGFVDERQRAHLLRTHSVEPVSPESAG